MEQGQRPTDLRVTQRSEPTVAGCGVSRKPRTYRVNDEEVCEAGDDERTTRPRLADLHCNLPCRREAPTCLRVMACLNANHRRQGVDQLSPKRMVELHCTANEGGQVAATTTCLHDIAFRDAVPSNMNVSRTNRDVRVARKSVRNATRDECQVPGFKHEMPVAGDVDYAPPIDDQMERHVTRQGPKRDGPGRGHVRTYVC